MNTFFKQSNRTLWKLPLLLVGALFTINSQAQVKHDFQVEQYNQLHWSPTQENFRRLHPMPAGVVYIQHPGEGEEEMRWHFRKMKELGYTCLKQIMVLFIPLRTFPGISTAAITSWSALFTYRLP